jgi:hypothetical protein
LTLIKQLKPEQRAQIQDLLSQDIELCKRMIESTDRIQKHMRSNIQFYKDVIRNRQSIENIAVRIKLNRSVMLHDKKESL